MTAVTDLARRYIAYQGATGQPGDLILDGLRNSIVKFIADLEVDASTRWVRDNDLAARELTDQLRAVDIDELEYRVRHELNSNDEWLYRPENIAKAPMDIYAKIRVSKLGQRDNNDCGIFSVNTGGPSW